ncbi:MAG TPA: class I SAM-dependent methyltransferase [Caldimonas sp.]|nr:class I SAM-dependent methyltransferase [Caldimonas sp.]HEX2542785.1 class I SAM-dependent methyltransferase [Caldimonas sp.]
MPSPKLSFSRVQAYYTLHLPISDYFRARRMRAFVETMQIREGASVLDLGGGEEIWATVATPLKVTILNLPGGSTPFVPSHHEFRHVVGDACDLRLDGETRFDVVFSNSVLEHVGPEDKQEAFAREVRRLGTSYWIQTPSPWFPLECHTGLPFWFLYPKWLQEKFLRRWQRNLPQWAQYIRDTRVLSKRRMRELFPDAEIFVERTLGVPKSYTAWQRVER